MGALIIAILPTLLGIIATVVAWNLNPKRRMYAELDALHKSLYGDHGLYRMRDIALADNNTDSLTVTNAKIIDTIRRINELLGRLK